MGDITIRFYEKQQGDNKKNDDSNIFAVRSYTMNTKILDIKNDIVADFFDKSKDYLDLVNISPRVFKDFGKVHMSLGNVPRTFDYYTLMDISNPDRTFEFLVKVVPKDTVEHIQDRMDQKFVSPEISNNHSYDNYSGNRDNNRRPYQGRVINNSYYQNEKNNKPKEFVMNDNDFPSL